MSSSPPRSHPVRRDPVFLRIRRGAKLRDLKVEDIELFDASQATNPGNISCWAINEPLCEAPLSYFLSCRRLRQPAHIRLGQHLVDAYARQYAGHGANEQWIPEVRQRLTHQMRRNMWERNPA